MPTLSPATAQFLADAILTLHVGVVMFVIFGQVAILIGAWRRWGWIRNFAFRLAHLLLMVFIAAQSWLGQLCPLTVWEMRLREIAGQDTYRVSFIEYWLSRLIFFEAPWWVFVAVYTAFAGLILASWWLIPPRRRRAGPKASTAA
jgi:hypothetical protein